jgi:predicted MFS family arabinose efflux permease
VLHVIDASGFRRSFIEFRHVLRVAWARQVLLTVSLEGAVIFGALSFVPVHLHSVHGLSLASSGSLVMLFGVGGLIFAVRSRDLVSRLGEVGLINAGALLVGVSLLVLALTPFWWLAFPACAGFGLGFYMLHNTLQINATQMAPERRGAAVAAFASCFFLGQALGVAAAGVGLSVVGTRVVLAACAALVVLIGLRFGRARRLRDVEASSAASRSA